MSGFIGMNNLFYSIEISYDIILTQEQRMHIIKTLLPLSKCKPNVTQIKEYTNMLQLESNIKNFIFKYLKANIKDMI